MRLTAASMIFSPWKSTPLGDAIRFALYSGAANA
jgi:hypothetical protein